MSLLRNETSANKLFLEIYLSEDCIPSGPTFPLFEVRVKTRLYLFLVAIFACADQNYSFVTRVLIDFDGVSCLVA